MDKMELKALGKINLGLDVLGRRENGYHDVRMVMQTVYLYDQIRIEKTKKPGIELSTNLFYLPVNENNLKAPPIFPPNDATSSVYLNLGGKGTGTPSRGAFTRAPSFGLCRNGASRSPGIR